MFDISADVSAIAVFVQGVLSFFSPCVLPLLPLYIGYLSGGAGKEGESGSRLRVMVNTFFFVLGVSGAFFLLGLGFTAAGRALGRAGPWIARAGGVIIILLGLYQLGIFGQSSRLAREKRLPVDPDRLSMNPITALILGFTFSFAWTPCVGPVLSSVLLMAGSSGSSVEGFLLIGAYTLGFTAPFLLTGIFADGLLRLFSKYMNIVKYTVKIGGVIMIIMGLLVVSGRMGAVSSSLASAASGSDDADGSQKQEDTLPDAPDMTFTDQNGVSHTLSDYRGKTVFLNFWATWCGPCKAEMPDVQALYEKYGENSGDLIVLGVANPKSDEYPNSNDVTAGEIAAFLEENGYTYPVLMDEEGSSLMDYGISAFPTTFMINTDGKVFGYVSGGLTAEMMDSIVEQTISGERVEK